MTPTATNTPAPTLRFDWTLNITTVVAIMVMVFGTVANYAVMNTRLSQVESIGAQQAVALEKQSNALRAVTDTLTRLNAQVEERERLVDLRQERSDFRQDKTELKLAR